MTNRPLVSVMLPCFNSAATLPFALASLRAQTVADWECLCIDDGSTDTTPQVLTAAARHDSRFKVERFAKNRGRGAARQRALEIARGKFLAFQDSDDWSYPRRLEYEAGWLDRDDKIAAVSGCAAVTDGPDRLVGVMRPRASATLPEVAEFKRPRPPPLIFPSSMIRTDLAKATGFDPAFRRSQDSDFLIRALLGRQYALGSEICYAYSQASAASLERTFEGYKFRMRAHVRHWTKYPVQVSRTIAETMAKLLVYRVAGVFGADRRLIERRWGESDDEARRGFEAALATVQALIPSSA
jgi:glycosyltransferase involved in cell wall biosynthesis